MFGGKPPPLAGWHFSRYPVTKQTQLGCVLHGRTHAPAPTTWRPSVHTMLWTRSTDATIAWAPTGMTSISSMDAEADPSPTWRPSKCSARPLQATRPDPQGQLLHRFNEHVCRVSGSQFLTRLGYPLETVQLIGRWGSDAVRRYVQEAPSSRPSINRTPTQRTVKLMVKRYLETITSKFWVKNTSTNVIHISGAPEFSTENIHWHTLCGWRYGQAPHTRYWSLPEGNQCQRCFRMQENQAITDANSDEEAVWNAPADSFS